MLTSRATRHPAKFLVEQLVIKAARSAASRRRYNHSDELRPTTDFSPSLASDRLHLERLERLYTRLKSLAS
ncbi:hypothetical protein V6N12_008461 [Hibiscus sabdariffa]|uniref:Uncharacterized protein n=1 Tax=Hibiscus sabdariffa TaxID=183260 RepID=A0ABR2BJK8_9ROSI